MTTIAVSSSFPLQQQQHREPTSLPPLRCVLSAQARHGAFSSSSSSSSAMAGVVKREKACDEEEEEALPVLMSMAQRSEAESRLPTISSMLSSSSKDMFGCPSSPQRTQMMVAPPSTTPPDRESSSSPVPQPSPSSPSQLSPGLFVSPLSSSPFSSSSPVPFSSSSTSSAADGAAVANQAYVSATNSLMELSDIISSTPTLQKLPVPRAGAAAEKDLLESSHSSDRLSTPEHDSACGVDIDDGVDRDYNQEEEGEGTSPVSSRTRRLTRRSKRQQKQIKRIRSEIELERDRARELEQELQLALQERAELLQQRNDAASAAGQAQASGSGMSFFNILNESAEGGSQLVLIDLPRANSLPSFSSTFASDAAGARPHLSSEGRSRSAPMLPPIASIPALSPYLKRKRASLPVGPDSRSLSPASSPLRPSSLSAAARTAAGGDSAKGLGRRRRILNDEDEDADYEPTSAAKKIKRSRSISEGGRRLQQSAGRTVHASGRRRSQQHYSADGDDHAEVAAFIARRARAIEDEQRATRNLQRMDVVEGAEQENDDQFEQKQEEGVSTRTTGPKRDGVLCFIKDHPHASFWLSRGGKAN